MVLASVDAQTCYDRVVHSTASLIFQALGVDLGAAVCMLSDIALMVFHIRTAHGDSTTTFGGNANDPFQGLLQGNGGAPAGWLAVSIFLIFVQKQLGHTLDMTTAISLTVVSLCALMYVDDTDIPLLARSSEETISQVVA